MALNDALVLGLTEGLRKAAAFKSNDRFPPRTKANVNALVASAHNLEEPHRRKALDFLERVTPDSAFEALHSMRRWYSGQTMGRKLLEHRDALGSAMKLDPEHAKGVYRGFKVDKDNPLASVSVGDKLTLDVTRNGSLSSWSTSEAPTHRFSGGGKGKVGLVIRLSDVEGIKPLLAPPTHSEPWFNALYERYIGTSFRPKEEEYLIHAPQVRVEVVRVKR